MPGKDIYWNSKNWINGSMNEIIELVDGKQKLNDVLGFMNNKVKSFDNYKYQFEDKLSIIAYDLIFHINNLSSQKKNC